MPWNPDNYNQFKEIRFKPFYDLAELIVGDTILHAVDLGCGTGEQTAILSEKLAEADFLGIDSSAEMLSGSHQLETERLNLDKVQSKNSLMSQGPGILFLAMLPYNGWKTIRLFSLN